MRTRIALSFYLGAAALLGSGIGGAAPAPQPSPETRRLGYFVGEWTSEAQVHPGPMGQGGAATGSSTCHWVEGNFFVSCKDESTTPMGRMAGLGVLGWNAAKKVYTWSGFNNLGQAETATGTVTDNTWTFVGQNDVGGKTMKTRYTVVETSPTSYTFRFETSTDGAIWTTVIDGKVTKK